MYIRVYDCFSVWSQKLKYESVMEIYFTNLCIIQLCLFRSWISERDLLFPVAFDFKMMDIHTFIQ